MKNSFDIVLIGHKNHSEVIGTMGQLPKDSIQLIETVDEVKNLNFTKPLAYVTQTTLSVDDTKEIIDALKIKFPNIKVPIKEDICYATTNRQSAVKKIAPNCEMFFVIGSKNSSNSARLVEVAKKSGCKDTELIFYGKKVPIDKIKNCKTIGLSSGASAPEELVRTFISEIKKNMKVSIEEVVTAKEKVVFKLPTELN